MVKGLFVADLHCSKSRLDDCLKVLKRIRDELSQKTPKPYLFICGDFWDAVITNGAIFAEYLKIMKEIISLTKVFMIYGTATHESEGSLEVFKHFGAYVYSKNTFVEFDDFELVAIPEPRKSHYPSDKNINDVIIDDLIGFQKSIPAKKKPRIVMYHGSIKGILMDNGLPCSSPIAVSPAYLKGFNADFIGCGHIHLKQEIFTNCWYLGSAPQKTLGEKHEPAFMDVEIC